MLKHGKARRAANVSTVHQDAKTKCCIKKKSRKHATTKKAPENSWEAGPHLLSPLQNYIFFNPRKGSVFRARFQ